MNTVKDDIWDMYRELLSRGVSPHAGRDALLTIARDLLSGVSDYAVRETVAQMIAAFRVDQARQDALTWREDEWDIDSLIRSHSPPERPVGVATSPRRSRARAPRHHRAARPKTPDALRGKRP
jgi:hypothetical protein